MLKGDIGDWLDRSVWETFGGTSTMEMNKDAVCTIGGITDGILMLFPSRLSWQGGRDMCRR